MSPTPAGCWASGICSTSPGTASADMGLLCWTGRGEGDRCADGRAGTPGAYRPTSSVHALLARGKQLSTYIWFADLEFGQQPGVGLRQGWCELGPGAGPQPHRDQT